MPRRTKQKGKYAKNEFEFKNVDFTAAETDHIVSYVESRTLVLEDAILCCVDQNYKISFGYNSWSLMYTGSITCKDDNSPAYNKCFVYEHTDVSRLGQVMAYLVEEVLVNGGALDVTQKPVNDW